MKINFFDVIICYIMRYKITIIGVILSLVCVMFVGIKGIVFLMLGVVAFLLNTWYNSTNLFESKFIKNSFFKKRMYNKYKEILGFKYAVIYNEETLKYHYITSEDEHFYICNIYLFVIKTYKKEKNLAYEYENRHCSSIIFIGLSRKEVSERFYEFLIVKIRKMYEEMRALERVCEKYCEIEREIEYHRYGK